MDNGIFVHKGTHSEIDSYSAFWDNNKIAKTELAKMLNEKNITDLYVCGLAYDVCVGNTRILQKKTKLDSEYDLKFVFFLGATAKHSLEHGYRTILIDDACRGVSVEDILCTRDTLSEENAVVVHSSQVRTY